MAELHDSWHFDMRPASYRLLEEQGRLLLTTSTSSTGAQTNHQEVFKTRKEATSYIVGHAREKAFVILFEHDDGRFTLERYA
ncbi:hypothetical protein [Endobacterium cereale]|uniref:hypothetical protein n=1 Tax=Endobacterium cereale TaxID=2663029 RepID=UPI002B4884B7|nr:hypothetical protein [Endobacterium cereale]MEB2843785.1 hypothetical protein [Endobacterium cereale]